MRKAGLDDAAGILAKESYDAILAHWEAMNEKKEVDHVVMEQGLKKAVQALVELAAPENTAKAFVVRMIAMDTLDTLIGTTRKRDRATANRRKANKERNKSKFWKPYQDQFHSLIKEGVPPGKARAAVGRSIKRDGTWYDVGDRPAPRTLKRRLKG